MNIDIEGGLSPSQMSSLLLFLKISTINNVMLVPQSSIIHKVQ
ncbi:hypothetical protein Mpsy_0159 [Methanolobus psychrophilus R15]|nr:hypothetical protein Mpsy_0159 [Methanolobus psychrophilus R15]